MGNSVKRLTDIQYKLNMNRSQMKKSGFRYDAELDDYVYRFPVYRYKNIPVNFCKIGIDEDTGKVWFNIYDANNMLYQPYYDRSYGTNEVVPEIDTVILAEFSRLGVREVKKVS